MPRHGAGSVKAGASGSLCPLNLEPIWRTYSRAAAQRGLRRRAVSQLDVIGLIAAAPEMTPADLWPVPDLAVMRLYRRPAPRLPVEAFGSSWAEWIATAAQ